ncbi:DUF2892 domain-containing protein [Ectothiorhodospiraceae bacterium WFHF3C12]|nr:DUF2892 domain-containing protein [Ectothiorhodospiraceae bacterium WFHF3C12]
MNALLPRNESTADRVIRVIAGLAILSLVLVGPQTLWGLLGLIPLITGLVGRCPAYRLLGLSTCPTRSSSAQH